MIFSSNYKYLLKRIINLHPYRYHHGYIILVPEIGEDAGDKNMIPNYQSLPEFNNFTIENCRAAISKQSLAFEAGIKNIEKDLQQATSKDIFEQVFKPLEVLGGPLDMTWGLSKTLYLGNSSLMPTSSYLAIHERARKARASKYNSSVIYNAVKQDLNVGTVRTNEETRILQKFATEGLLNGLELNSNKKMIMVEYLNKLTKEKTLFKQKTEVSTKRFFQIVTDFSIVRHFPKDTLKLLAADPNVPEKGPWKLTLHPYSYVPVMEYCPDREIRWNLWQALVGRGTKMGDAELATSLHIEEIRSIRRDLANLLGFNTFADMSLQTKMAANISEIKGVLSTLLDTAKNYQDSEVQQLCEFAVQNGHPDNCLELWDVPYWRKQQQLHLYKYNETNYKSYFPLKLVLDGLIKLCQRLFGVQIKERKDVTGWHKDVKFYDVFEVHSSAPVAGFYFDPYARGQQKLNVENNGWMVAIQNKSEITKTKPLASLIFNFDPPIGTNDTYLSFKEMKSLFIKFGNCLQHLLTRTTYSEVSGLSNVEWDTVNVCGYVLSYWLYNKHLVKSLSSHFETGDTLPDEMFKALINSEQHMLSFDFCNELYLASLDLELHTSKDFWLDIVKVLWPQYRSIKLNKSDVHPCSFTQIFSEEWGAAYYCDIWSNMLAADIYSAFYEVRDSEIKTVDVGIRFRNLFLALGGSVHPSQIFREFRGRDPSPKALLTNLGLQK